MRRFFHFLIRYSRRTTRRLVFNRNDRIIKKKKRNKTQKTKQKKKNKLMGYETEPNIWLDMRFTTWMTFFLRHDVLCTEWNKCEHRTHIAFEIDASETIQCSVWTWTECPVAVPPIAIATKNYHIFHQWYIIIIDNSTLQRKFETKEVKRKRTGYVVFRSVLYRSFHSVASNRWQSKPKK